MKKATKAMVILYDADDLPKSIKEIGRSAELDYWTALNLYANTPNPASQLLEWNSEEEKKKVMEQHARDIKDQKWLNMLHDQI